MLALLLTVEETAAMLNLHAQTVRGFIKNGLLTKIVLGRAVRLRVYEVRRLAEIGTVALAAERAAQAQHGGAR
jgi:excisionase family DNA binding protein